MQRRSVETKQKIMVVAASLFASRGYRDTTLNDIVSGAGVTTGALYFHFDSKEEIARRILEEQHEISSEHAREIVTSGSSAVDALTHLSANLGYVILTNPVVHAGTQLSTETQLFPEVYTRPWEDWIETVRYLLQRGIVEGDVDPNANIDALAQLIAPAFTGVRFASELLHKGEDLLQRLRDLSTSLLPAFAREERRAALLADANAIFDSYERKLAEFRAAAEQERLAAEQVEAAEPPKKKGRAKQHA